MEDEVGDATGEGRAWCTKVNGNFHRASRGGRGAVVAEGGAMRTTKEGVEGEFKGGLGVDIVSLFLSVVLLVVVVVEEEKERDAEWKKKTIHNGCGIGVAFFGGAGGGRSKNSF